MRLAVQSGADFWGGEPSATEIAAHLTSLGFAREDVFFANMFGPLSQNFEAKVFSSSSDPCLISPSGAGLSWMPLNTGSQPHRVPMLFVNGSNATTASRSTLTLVGILAVDRGRPGSRARLPELLISSGTVIYLNLRRDLR